MFKFFNSVNIGEVDNGIYLLVLSHTLYTLPKKEKHLFFILIVYL